MNARKRSGWRYRTDALRMGGRVVSESVRLGGSLAPRRPRGSRGPRGNLKLPAANAHRGSSVRPWRTVVGGLILVLLLILPPPAAAVHTGDTSSTMISQLGEFRSLAVDPVRGRLYATDDASFDGTKVVGLDVIDLNTHGEITRIPLSDLTGVALSPGASRLVVGSRDGYLRVINPDTLLVTREQFFYGDPFTAAYMWDMAFDGEDRL